MLFQATIELNFGMSLIEALVAAFALYLIASILNNVLREEVQVSKKVHMFSSGVSSLIIFGIILAIRLLLESLSHFYIIEGYYLFRYLTTDLFLFAIMVTIFLFFHAIFLRRFSKNRSFDDENNIQNEQFRRLYIKFLIVAWIVGGIFLSSSLLQISLEYADIFYLGFIWAFFVVGFAIIITWIVNKTRPVETRIPKFVLNRAIYTGGLISFGIWSIQLVIVELYLRRLFGITLYIQDIRFLIVVVNAIYATVYVITLKKIFKPQALERSEGKIQKASELFEKMKIDEERRKGTNIILEVQDLTTRFYTEEGIVKAVEGVSFKIKEGEVLGLVGETGCGKSVTALSILQLVRPPGKIERGKVVFQGEDLLQKSTSEVLEYRGKDITMIFQDPLNSINPVFKIGDQITEVYLLHMENELLIEASKQDKSIFAVRCFPFLLIIIIPLLITEAMDKKILACLNNWKSTKE